MSAKEIRGISLFHVSVYIEDVFRQIFLEKGDENEAEIKGNSNHSIHNDAFRHGAADSVSFDQWLSV